MLNERVRFVAVALLLTLTTLVAVAPVRAEIWSGSWDPPFDSPFTLGDGFPYNLGWGGKVKVNDDACGGGPFVGDVSNAGACGGGAFVVAGTLFVNLYSHPNLTPLATLTLNAASLTIDTLRYDPTGTLTAFSTLFESDYVQDISPSYPAGAGTGAYFAIQFVLDGLPCIYCGEFGPLPGDYDGPVLFAGTFPDECDGFCDFYQSNVAEFPAEISFTPEPASLALIAGSLLAAGAAGRRPRSGRREGQAS